MHMFLMDFLLVLGTSWVLIMFLSWIGVSMKAKSIIPVLVLFTLSLCGFLGFSTAALTVATLITGIGCILLFVKLMKGLIDECNYKPPRY